MTPILLACLVWASNPVLAPADDAPRQLGDVRTGPPIAQSLTLTHRGPAGTLAVTAVESPCGCLKPSTTRDVLRPGEATTLSVTVNTLTQPAGPQTWRTTLKYRFTPDDPATPPHDGEVVFAVSANLVREVSVTPPMLAISTTREATLTLTVSDTRAKPLNVLTATTTSPHVTATILPGLSSPGPRATPVELRLAADYPPGVREETIVLTTDDPGCRELRVPLRVVKRKPDAIVAAPESAVVQFAQGQEEASTLLQVRSPARGPLRIAAVECDHAAVRARFSQGAGLVGTVRVVVDRARADGKPGEAVLRVTFGEPAGEVLLVPVRWLFPG